MPDTVVPDKATPDKATPDKPADKIKRPIKADLRPTKVEPAEIKPPGTDPRVTPEVKGTPEVTRPPAALTATAVASQWQRVGEQIKALGPGQDDLWNRYRRININTAMKDPTALREAADILAKLARDLAKLKN